MIDLDLETYDRGPNTNFGILHVCHFLPNIARLKSKCNAIEKPSKSYYLCLNSLNQLS